MPGPTAAAPPTAGWIAVVAHGVVAGLTQLLWLSYAPIATETADHLGVSVGAVGWLTNVFPLIYVLLAIPAGLALDRRPRATMATGAVLVALGAVVRVVWSDFAGALTGQVLVSLAQPILLGGVAVIAARRLPERSRAGGIAAGSAGVFGGLLLGIAMPTLFGGDRIDSLVAVQAALAVAGCLAMLATLEWRGLASEDGAAPAAAGRAVLGQLLRDPFQRTLLLLACGGFGTFVALLTWLQALLEPAGISEDTSGGLLLVLVLAGFVTTAFLPALVVRRHREATMLRVTLPIAGVACLALAVAPPVAVVAVSLAVIGALLLPALPVMLELAEQHAGDDADEATASGAASSLLWLSGNLGGFAVALVVGALLDEPAIAFGLVALFTFAVAVTAGRRLPRQLA